MEILPVRLSPGQDLKSEIDALTLQHDWPAAIILSAVGSLTEAPIRFANRDEVRVVKGHLEILTLSGTLSRDGSHLHLCVADGTGKVCGGHLKEGAIVFTTAELVIGILNQWEFSRETCEQTGFLELVVKRKANCVPPSDNSP